MVETTHKQELQVETNLLGRTFGSTMRITWVVRYTT
jgi:hypothetical protein